MTPERRVVRATTGLFEDLDRQLPPTRGADGQPSAHDFATYELLRIVEQFATGFDDMEAPVPGRDDYRVLVAAGMLVPAFAVVGQLVSDGAVELLQLEIDFEVD